MNKLYERILSLCEQRKIKPGRMCGAIGVSRGNITDLKMGRIESLSAETLSKISEYFGVTVDYLLGKTDFPYPDLTGKTMRFDPIETAPLQKRRGQAQSAERRDAQIIGIIGKPGGHPLSGRRIGKGHARARKGYRRNV